MKPLLLIVAVEPMPLPLALLVLGALYGLPAGAWFFASRRNLRVTAVVLAMLATVLSAFVSRSFFPRSRDDFAFWLLVAGVPLLGSLCSLLFAFKRLRTPREKA
jgi:hypothetical protein